MKVAVVVAGGSGIGRDGIWGPFCISPFQRREEGRASKILHPPLSHVCFAPRNNNPLGSRLLFIFVVVSGGGGRAEATQVRAILHERRKTVSNHLKNEGMEISSSSLFVTSLSLSLSLSLSHSHTHTLSYHIVRG